MTTSKNSVAVLYRTNAQSRTLEDALRRSGIDYRIVGSVRFYERKEIKDILAYLKLLLNPHDNVSLRRVINVPARGDRQRRHGVARRRRIDTTCRCGAAARRSRPRVRPTPCGRGSCTPSITGCSRRALSHRWQRFATSSSA